MPSATSTSGVASAPTTAAPSRSPVPVPRATDDEILGIVSPRKPGPRSAAALPQELNATRLSDEAGDASGDDETVSDPTGASSTVSAGAEVPENLRAVFDSNPELRAAWQDAQAYRETFATPEEARNATALIADVTRMDALFFSRRPEDHAALARSIAALDPASFQSLARAIGEYAASQVARPGGARTDRQGAEAGNQQAESRSGTGAAASPASQILATGNRQNEPATSEVAEQSSSAPASLTRAQTEFFESTNAAAVETVVSAIESQVEKLLPEGIAKSARGRVVGEIYRELDSALRSNRQLAAQMRDAFRSGSLDADHQRAIVSLITARARQALPAVAKRVLNEWTSTLVSANQERRTRQRTAEHRVDIAGSSGGGNDGRRTMSPRDLDYARLSDADILNL